MRSCLIFRQEVIDNVPEPAVQYGRLEIWLEQIVGFCNGI